MVDFHTSCSLSFPRRSKKTPQPIPVPFHCLSFKYLLKKKKKEVEKEGKKSFNENKR